MNFFSTLMENIIKELKASKMRENDAFVTYGFGYGHVLYVLDQNNIIIKFLRKGILCSYQYYLYYVNIKKTPNFIEDIQDLKGELLNIDEVEDIEIKKKLYCFGSSDAIYKV